MVKPIKKIGILTSGGDAPGMNAAIRAVTRTAVYKGMEVVGIRYGFDGLLKREIAPLNALDVSGLLFEGGSMLCSARCDEFKQEAGVQKGVRVCHEFGIDGLVIIGGDGSFRGAGNLSVAGVPCIGIPGTIDNDIPCSEYSIGFDTAITTVTEMAERLRDTSQSHNRCNMIEVMGQRSGDLALHAGIASGATAILLPEANFTLDNVTDKMLKTREMGKRYFLIVVSEAVTATKIRGAMTIHEMAAEIERLSGVVTRATELGYIQRGGKPSPRDRIIASQLGTHAIDLLAEGRGNRVVIIKNNLTTDMDITEALRAKKSFSHSLYEVSEAVAI